MKKEIKLMVKWMLKTYKKDLIMDEMVKDVILHDAYENYSFIPSQIELDWLIHSIRFEVVNEELLRQIEADDEKDFMNWIYS